MGFTIQNFETGEVDYIRCDHNNVQRPEYDEETGEPMTGRLRVRYVKHESFKIPKHYLRGTKCEEFDNAITGDYQENSQAANIEVGIKVEKPSKPTKYQRDDFIDMEGVQKEIIMGYNKNSLLLFLLPTFFFFNFYFAFLMFLIESFLHYWAHKKNGLNMNKRVYFKSPLHILTSQFCATCRSESEMDMKIFDMLSKQMRQAQKSKTLKDVTKVIS